jgi:CRISPR system Cascade subunit CasC
MGIEIYKRLVDKGASEKNSEKWASTIAGVFGAVKKKAPLEIEQLAHIAPAEWDTTMALADTLAKEEREPNKEELELLRVRPKAVDIAMFGRMLASSPKYNVEAAVQVAHAITVNPVNIENDYFTAVDDLNTNEEDAGAAHIGDAGFGSGIFYQYVCINRDLLIKNLQGDEVLANQAVAALTESAAKIAPTGKQNSFASRAYTSYLLAEKGLQQPRSLSVAFLTASKGADPLKMAIDKLEEQRISFDKVYGDCADEHHTLNAQTGEGSLKDIIKFVTAQP